jgi:hypothetical protein
MQIKMSKRKCLSFFFSQLKIENLNGENDLVLIKKIMIILHIFDKNGQYLVYKILISFFEFILIFIYLKDFSRKTTMEYQNTTN